MIPKINTEQQSLIAPSQQIAPTIQNTVRQVDNDPILPLGNDTTSDRSLVTRTVTNATPSLGEIAITRLRETLNPSGQLFLDLIPPELHRLIFSEMDLNTLGALITSNILYLVGTKEARINSLTQLRMATEEAAGDINTPVDDHENTVLHKAAQSGHTDLAYLLIQQKANVNAVNKYNQSPLYSASFSQSTQAVKQLIDLRANINAKCNHGWTPLHCAIILSDMKMVQLLIDLRADINAKANYNQTCLHFAAGSGCTETTQLFINLRADINARDANSRTPLHNSITSKHKPTVQLLIYQRADINAQARYGETPLYDAAEYGLMEIVQVLIQSRAKIDGRETFKARSCGHKEVANFLDNSR